MENSFLQTTEQPRRTIHETLLNTMMRYEELLEEQDTMITQHEDTIKRLMQRIRTLNKELKTQRLINKVIFKDLNHICEENCICRN